MLYGVLCYLLYPEGYCDTLESNVLATPVSVVDRSGKDKKRWRSLEPKWMVAHLGSPRTHFEHSERLRWGACVRPFLCSCLVPRGSSEELKSYYWSARKLSRDVPVKFLVDKYTEILQDRLRSLPAGNRRHEALTNKAIDRFQDVIDDLIFSWFHSNCYDKLPDEICGSAKSIVCFVPWGHSNSVFDGVHAKVVHMLEQVFRGESSTEKVKQAIVVGVRGHCPGECKDWGNVIFRRSCWSGRRRSTLHFTTVQI